MNIKSLKLLRIGALILGWILLITELWKVCLLIAYYHNFLNIDGGGIALASRISSYFFGLGNVFLAFLVAAVLRMIEKESPVMEKNARRLMIVCCLSFLVDTIVRSCTFILSLPDTIRILTLNDWVSNLPYFIGFPPFAPFLYAASIFVLFTHFTKMVTFESEVA
jgi:hypothetical protein